MVGEGYSVVVAGQENGLSWLEYLDGYSKM